MVAGLRRRVGSDTITKPLFRRMFNRILHWVARQSPGSTSLRPFLHRMRGVIILGHVFIGDDVYIDNEFPECVEIGENASISIRVILIAHTRGPGKIIIEKDAFVGPNSVVCCRAGQVIRIGHGSVIGAGSVITRNVDPQTFVAPAPTRPIARVLTPLTERVHMEEFLSGMTPIGRMNRKS